MKMIKVKLSVLNRWRIKKIVYEEQCTPGRIPVFVLMQLSASETNTIAIFANISD